MVMEIRSGYIVDVFGGNKIIFAGTVGYKAQEDLSQRNNSSLSAVQ